MKKIILLIVTLVATLNAQGFVANTPTSKPVDLSKLKVNVPGFSFNPFTGEYDFNMDALFDMIGSCVPALPKFPALDVCSVFDKVDASMQFCGNNVNANKALKEFCKQGKEKLTDKVVGSLPTFDIVFDELNEKLPSGRKIGDLDLDIAAEKIVKKAESAAYKAYGSGDQRVLKLLIDKLAKDNSTKGSGKNAKDITSIKVDDLKVPKNMEEYYSELKVLQEAATSDLKVSSSNRVAESIGSNSDNAQPTVQELHRLIDQGTAKRIGIAREALSKEDDYAMPTEEGIKYLRPDYKIQAMAKIYNQQMREVFLISQIQKEADAQKNIVTITAKKQMILNTKFPRSEVEQRIESLIER
ncbi:MAG: hypothetical protein LBG67_02195 [Campylobacteraceae bacterium]|nr:hypothetical protein [Campylobacteraceae bacterium]